MRHSVDANLAGHDSHGIIQIPTYIDRMQVGHIVPGACPKKRGALRYLP